MTLLSRPKTTAQSSSERERTAWPRYVNAALGAWLFMSAYLWPHDESALNSAWIIGALMFVAAWVALAVPAVRFVDTALAVWLLVATLLLARTSGTLWAQILVAALAFSVSLVPNHAGTPQIAHFPPEPVDTDRASEDRAR